MRATSNPLSLAIAMAMMGTITVSHAQDLGLQEAENEVKTSSSGVLEEVIVTAAKVEASIQDTPIAVSAFSQDQLDSQLINDTMNLQFNVPNMTMTKQNFTANDIRIRGIGSGAIGPAGDSGVGIHINGVYQTSTRIFETQFFDTQRVEVLRGPQGTLYGRNTTGGVVNIITAKANPDEFEAAIDGSVGNYSFRQVRGMVNVPVGDDFAIRLAGMSMKRDGFIENVFDGEDVDDRDIWSGRLSLRWTPGDDTSIDFVASYFEEDDSRVRSQKQACNTDPTGILGCLPGRLTYGVANTAGGIAGALMASVSSINTGSQGVLGQLGMMTGGAVGNAALLNNVITGATAFPYNEWASGDNNPDDPREIISDVKPRYYSEEKNIQLHINHDFGNLQLAYSVGWSETSVNSVEDYEKGVPTETWDAALQSLVDLGNTPALDAATWAPQLTAMGAGALIPFITNAVTGIPGVGLWAGNPALTRLGNGVPVLDPDDKTYYLCKNVCGLDESSNSNKQWAHEVRLQSSFDGPLNFLLGGFYLDFDNTNAYIVRSSGLALPGLILPINFAVFPAPVGDPNNPRSETDPYMLGYHNDSRIYNMNAKAVFGEVYWDVTDALRLTVGGRYSEETKEGKQRTIYVTFSDLPPIQPNNAYFEPFYEQEEFTWRANATWNMSDDTMMYATVSSSFKSGGFNPISDNSPLVDPAFGGSADNAFFDPEFIDSFELGIKTTLLDGAMRINAAGFFYDYKDLQQSKIVNVTSLNQNTDAEITGLELDVLFAITPNLIASLSGGWLDTEIGNFETVDTANPMAVPDSVLATNPVAATQGLVSVNGVNFVAAPDYSRCEVAPPAPCPGYVQSLNGNQIAGSPELNYNIGLAYTMPLGSMDLTLSTNYYWQDEFYASNFNNLSNLVDDWSMWNASARLSGENWYAEAWIKNIEDNDNVTGQYLTSSVSNLFTNQFMLDPQTYGLSLGYRF